MRLEELKNFKIRAATLEVGLYFMMMTTNEPTVEDNDWLINSTIVHACNNDVRSFIFAYNIFSSSLSFRFNYNFNVNNIFFPIPVDTKLVFMI
jgi:hypothetical protein